MTDAGPAYGPAKSFEQSWMTGESLSRKHPQTSWCDSLFLQIDVDSSVIIILIACGQKQMKILRNNVLEGPHPDEM